MTAYNINWLHNLFIQQQAQEAFEDNLIQAEERQNIFEKYSSSFYTPNFFIRIGLFILTIVIALFSFGLLSLMILSSAEKYFGGLLIFFSLPCFFILETMIKKNLHYRSGVDDALLLIGAACLCAGLCYVTETNLIGGGLIIFIFTVICSIRYADSVVTCISFIALLALVFYILIDAGSFVKNIIPFIIMAISLIVYFISKNLSGKYSFIPYTGCLVALQICSLLAVASAGNYFVVSEMIGLYDMPAGQSIPFSWFFWFCTIVIPFVYIFLGIIKREMLLLRIGLVLIAAIVFTVRYFYHAMPAETAMTLGGLFLLLVSWLLTHYLKEPKGGYTSQEIKNNNDLGKSQLEALLLAQTFSHSGSADSNTKFGGGDFGGGGASGDF